MERVVAEIAGESLRIRAKELRGERTLSEIAARIGMRQDDLGRIERGETQSIRYETLLKLCTVFNVTPNEIFEVTSFVPRTSSPLERILSGIEAGNIRTHKVGPRERKIRPKEPVTELDAVAEFSDIEEPFQSRKRTRVPSSARR